MKLHQNDLTRSLPQKNVQMADVETVMMNCRKI